MFTPSLLLLSLSLLPYLTSSVAQSCSKPGYGADSACVYGADPYCDGHKCLYQTCAKGFYASQVHEEGVIYDSQTANHCTACPGEHQTTDVSSGGLTYGIGECYVPCGPAKCYVPSTGGLSLAASQTGLTQCTNAQKGICESTCKLDGSLPIPDAYTIGAVCNKTRLKKRTGPNQPRASARRVRKDTKAAKAATEWRAEHREAKKDGAAAAAEDEPANASEKRTTSGQEERERARKAKRSQMVKRAPVPEPTLGPKSYELERGPYARAADQFRY